VNFLEDGRPFVEVHVRKRGKPADGRVYSEVTGGGDSRPNPFWIHGVSISCSAW
jgi:hypothetical protein